MGYGKIIGLGAFDITYNPQYDLSYKGHGQIITLSKTSVPQDETGGQRAREDDIANGQNATSPVTYTADGSYSFAVVWAPA